MTDRAAFASLPESNAMLMSEVDLRRLCGIDTQIVDMLVLVIQA